MSDKDLITADDLHKEDYTAHLEVGEHVWLRVGSLSLRIKRTEYGAWVEGFNLGQEADDAIVGHQFRVD